MRKVLIVVLVFCFVFALYAANRETKEKLNETSIAAETKEDTVTMQGKVIEIHDSEMIIEPVLGSMELQSSSRFSVPTKQMNLQNLQVSDLVEIVYSGGILETFPARFGEVLSIKVLD